MLYLDDQDHKIQRVWLSTSTLVIHASSSWSIMCHNTMACNFLNAYYVIHRKSLMNTCYYKSRWQFIFCSEDIKFHLNCFSQFYIFHTWNVSSTFLVLLELSKFYEFIGTKIDQYISYSKDLDKPLIISFSFIAYNVLNWVLWFHSIVFNKLAPYNWSNV